MKGMIFLLLLISTQYVSAQGDMLPGGPLDPNLDLGRSSTYKNTPNEEFQSPRTEEQQREEEMLESRFDVPDKKDKEKKQYNKNGTQEP